MALCIIIQANFIFLFYGAILDSQAIGKTLQPLAMSHEVPAGSREVAVAFNFISERTLIQQSAPNKYIQYNNIRQQLFIQSLYILMRLQTLCVWRISYMLMAQNFELRFRNFSVLRICINRNHAQKQAIKVFTN